MNSPSLGSRDLHTAVKIALSVIFALILPFVTTAASESVKLPDETIRRLIPGGWISQERLDGRLMKLIVEYRPDGTLGASAKMIKGRYANALVLSGTWRVRNGILITHTEATGMPARVTTHEVIAVNETMLILRDRDGVVVVKRRAPLENSQ
jgi:hypothetical protein